MSKLKYVSRFVDNRGAVRYRFRRRGVSHYFESYPDTVEFENEYRSLLAGIPLPKLRFQKRRRAAPVEGGVYFIAAGRGRIKIGWACNIRRRLKELQISNSVRLSLLATIPGGRREEEALHERFAHLRTRGEWFRAMPELTDYIEGLKAGSCLAPLSSNSGSRG